MEWGLFGTAVTGMQSIARSYLFAGMFLLACFAITHYYLYLRLRDADHKNTYLIFYW